MSGIVFYLWPAYIIGFIFALLCRAKFRSASGVKSLIFAGFCFIAINLLFLSVKGEVGVGLVMAPFLLLAVLFILTFTGYAAGAFISEISADKRWFTIGFVAVALLAIPGFISLTVLGFETQAKNKEIETRNAIWGKVAVAEFGQHRFNLPLSPRIQLGVRRNSKSSYGALLRRKRGLIEVYDEMKRNDGELLLNMLIVGRINTGCKGEHAPFCKDVSAQLIDEWCQQYGPPSASLWCDTRLEAQEFEIHFQLNRTGITVEDGYCDQDKCYGRFEIEPSISAVVEFDKTDGDIQTQILRGQSYASKVWADLLEIRQ